MTTLLEINHHIHTTAVTIRHLEQDCIYVNKLLKHLESATYVKNVQQCQRAAYFFKTMIDGVVNDHHFFLTRLVTDKYVMELDIMYEEIMDEFRADYFMELFHT